MKPPITKFLNREFFIFLLPVFFVFHGYSEHFPVIPAKDALRLLFFYLLGTAAIAVIFYFVLRSWRRSALCTFIIMFFYLFFGASHDFIKTIFPGSIVSSYKMVVPLALGMLVFALLFIKKKRREFNRVVPYLNLVLLLLILADVFFLSGKMSKANENLKPEDTVKPTVCDTCVKPEIHLIISDEYAGDQQLKDLFGYDNSAFYSALRERGFHVIDRSLSNYNSTPFSVASLMMMDYLPPVPGGKITQEGINKSTAIINDAALLTHLKKQGYKIMNNSIFNINDEEAAMETRFLPKKIRLISDQTFLSRLNRDIRFNLVTQLKWTAEMERIADQRLDGVSGIYEKAMEPFTDTTTPKFIYTHLLMPHYPYFFDSAGRKASLETVMKNTSGKEEYISYLKYSNKKFIQLFDAIINQSKRPPIIIFASDHGFRHLAGDTSKPYQFMNVCAVYLPSKKYEKFYPGMSNVNLFRVLLNTQFNQNLPLLKDSTVFLRE